VATLAEARRAKDSVADLLQHRAEVNGVGITRLDDGYAVKVNLASSPEPDFLLPASVNGVPVTWEVVGEIRKRGP
jgi:hypothetical protein